AEVETTLSRPLSGDDAVRLALAYSPSLQAILFEGASASAEVTQAARLPNPVFSFEKLMRGEGAGRELDIGRTIGVSILDVLLLPQRQRAANSQQQQIALKLAGDVVQAATDARQAWVRAVAARQQLQYAEQVKAAAD